MPYDPARDLIGLGATHTSPGNSGYFLTNGMIGSAELPIYAKAIRVTAEASVAAPMTISMVMKDMGDSDVQVHSFFTGVELAPFMPRRITAINGGATIPAGVTIYIFTK